MKATIIDGRGLAAATISNVTEQVKAMGLPLHLAAVCVGEDESLRSFVRLKQKAAQAAGIEFSSYLFDGKDEREVKETLKYLADDETVDGIFLELPLPPSWDRRSLLSLIPADKDGDVISPEGERLYYSDKNPITPPAVRALEIVLQEYGVKPDGLEVAIIGAGHLVGLPISHWLKNHGAAVSVIDIDTPEPENISSRCDLVIACAGSPGLVSAAWIRPGAAVIDFGYGRDEAGTTAGDVVFDDVVKKAGIVSPVPGGMGPLVIAAVLENLVTLAGR